MWVKQESTAHNWEWLLHTTNKNGDLGMVYGIVFPTLIIGESLRMLCFICFFHTHNND